MSDAELRVVWRKIVSEQRERRKLAEQEVEEDDSSDDVGSSQQQDLLEMSWREQLLDVLLSIEPDAFERLCQRLLRESGFTKVEITGRTGDGGIDGVGVLRMNLLSFHVLFQCKRWRDSVSSPVVRNFRGAMVGRADKGLIITTGTFTADARREATRDGAPAIDLIDGDTLCDLLKETKIGVSVSLVEHVTINAEALRSI
jgi:restriction system protein